MKKLIPLLLLSLSGCTWLIPPQNSSMAEKATETIANTVDGENFSMLVFLGSVAVIGGIALLVISGGRKGWYPLIIGIGLILLNWLVLYYAHALFIPVVIATGSLTLAFGYKAVESILLYRKRKK